jgi:hypothetical protein
LIAAGVRSDALLVAAARRPFFVRAVRAEIDFVRDAAGKVTELVLHQSGQNLHGKRRVLPR